MKKYSILFLFTAVSVFCLTVQLSQSQDKLTSDQISQAEFENFLDKILSGEIDDTQAQNIVSKIKSGESYDNALKLTESVDGESGDILTGQSSQSQNKLTSDQISQAEFEDFLDKITSGIIDKTQAQSIVSNIKSGESYDNALKLTKSVDGESGDIAVYVGISFLLLLIIFFIIMCFKNLGSITSI